MNQHVWKERPIESAKPTLSDREYIKLLEDLVNNLEDKVRMFEMRNFPPQRPIDYPSFTHPTKPIQWYCSDCKPAIDKGGFRFSCGDRKCSVGKQTCN